VRATGRLPVAEVAVRPDPFVRADAGERWTEQVVGG
jgi:hypothetical protein